MSGLIAPKPLQKELASKAQVFLDAMRSGQFDFIFSQLITNDSSLLLSATLWPQIAYKEAKVDEFIKLSMFDQLAMSFQLDVENIRTEFFAGIANGWVNIGWYEFSDTDCLVFVDGKDAVLAASAAKQIPLILPFSEDNDKELKVDFGALLLFSMEIRASSLYRIAIRAHELGNQQAAFSMFELVASLNESYSLLRRLISDHAVIGQFITNDRKRELEEEARYALLARDRVLQSLSDETVAKVPLNIARFLADTFRGYSEIPAASIDQSDLLRLYDMGDGNLRRAIASILNGVDPVYAQREASKPHSGIEISDMELVVEVSDVVYQFCMPFKSGREIYEDKVHVKYSYQIIRPFMYFPKCIVVFITAKPCSQHLHNYIKQAIATQGWAIGVIEHEALAKLLKINSRL